MWFFLLGLEAIWHCVMANKTHVLRGLVFSAGGLLHLLLDSIVGDIWWLAPIEDQPYALFTAPAVYESWWLNFILHWSFALEVLVVLWVILLLWSSKSSQHKSNNGVKDVSGETQTQGATS